MNEWIIFGIKLALGLLLPLLTVPMLVWMERKVSARFQFRVGPNNLGPYGMLQSFADAVKLIFKEQFAPRGTDMFMYFAAPVIAFLPGLISFSLIPVGELEIGGKHIILSAVNTDLSLIVILAVSSLTSYGLAYAGWSTGNQYALLGGIRSSAQLISYEIIIGLSVVSILMITGTLNLYEIVQFQKTTNFNFLPGWLIFQQPVTFLLFLIASFAETNRAPFDLPEAEQELVGGYHTEYAGIRWAWFMFGEYAALFTMSSLVVTLFLGGWTLPYVTGRLPDGIWYGVFSFLIFAVKVGLMIFFYMWVRWTLPRFRWDQLMRIAWLRLIPIGIVNIFITAYFFGR